MDAKIHKGENELEFKLQKLTAEIDDMGKISGKVFPDNIKILLRENSSSLHWEKNEAPKVPSTHSLIQTKILNTTTGTTSDFIGWDPAPFCKSI